MITKIGIIYQDLNSRKFLEGIKRRLLCNAELLLPTSPIGTARVLTRKNARLAWQNFRKRGAQIVVRLTDADGHRWQDVRRDDLRAVPEEAKEVWVCGVAVNNVEEWLHLDAKHLATEFGLDPADLKNARHCTDRIKRAIGKARIRNGRDDNVVAQFVHDVPSDVFRRWLSDDALQAFLHGLPQRCRKS